MAVSLNQPPYNDDFDATSGYHRILFRPGYAVQARELTQLQTILQNQIKQHGDSAFKDGDAVIDGDRAFLIDVDYVKLYDRVGVDNNPSTDVIDVGLAYNSTTLSLSLIHI